MARNYYTISDVTDYGPFVTKIILPMPQSVLKENISADCFSAYVERKDENGEILLTPKSWMAQDDKEESKGYVEILGAYPSDINGKEQNPGNFVTLKMKYGPGYSLSAGIYAPHGQNVFIFSEYRITQTKEIITETGKISGLVFDTCFKNTTPIADEFRHGVSSHPEYPLNYGYFIPQTGNGKRPLIIWLHGAGEGGVDPKVAYAGNKVTALATEDIQKKFGGAYLLVPQTPTFWLNDGTGEYGNTGKTIYSKPLKFLIDEFIEKNDSAIDKNRIYIGGDSNGGFMTMRMIIDYPDFFAAAFPICEALYNASITDEDINKIKNLPIWFTHSKNDPIVKPENYVLPTYKRLIAAGAEKVHFSFFDKVIDLHGEFKKENGEPYEYIGHFSWIPFLNNDCNFDFDGKPYYIDGKPATAIDFISKQHK